MTGSSPRDLAVAFRSLGRRLREAQDGADEDRADVVTAATEQLRGVVEAAGEELGVATAGDVASMGEVVAAAIERVPADKWEVPRLDRLRDLALEAGRLLRVIAAAQT